MQGTASLTVGCAIIIGCTGGSILYFKAASVAASQTNPRPIDPRESERDRASVSGAGGRGLTPFHGCPARSSYHKDKHCVCDLGYACTHTDAQLATVHCHHGYRQISGNGSKIFSLDSLPRSGFRRRKCPLCHCSFVPHSTSSSPTRRDLLEVDAPSSSSPKEPTQPRELHPANQALLSVLKTVRYDHPVSPS